MPTAVTAKAVVARQTSELKMPSRTCIRKSTRQFEPRNSSSRQAKSSSRAHTLYPDNGNLSNSKLLGLAARLRTWNFESHVRLRHGKSRRPKRPRPWMTNCRCDRSAIRHCVSRFQLAGRFPVIRPHQSSPQEGGLFSICHASKSLRRSHRTATTVCGTRSAVGAKGVLLISGFSFSRKVPPMATLANLRQRFAPEAVSSSPSQSASAESLIADVRTNISPVQAVERKLGLMLGHGKSARGAGSVTRLSTTPPLR